MDFETEEDWMSHTWQNCRRVWAPLQGRSWCHFWKIRF